jgi:hypothetical protein
MMPSHTVRSAYARVQFLHRWCASLFYRLLMPLVLFYFFPSAREAGFDVVLVDTAGRMQDNEPLMIALTKVTHALHSMVFAP